jgi:hypothetical protein
MGAMVKLFDEVKDGIPPTFTKIPSFTRLPKRACGKFYLSPHENVFTIALANFHCLHIYTREVDMEKIMKKSFSYRGAASWNNLPNDVANNYKELSISNFKTLINNYFINLERNSV